METYEKIRNLLVNWATGLNIPFLDLGVIEATREVQQEFPFCAFSALIHLYTPNQLGHGPVSFLFDAEMHLRKIVVSNMTDSRLKTLEKGNMFCGVQLENIEKGNPFYAEYILSTNWEYNNIKNKASKGDMDAIRQLADMYYRGEGVPRDCLQAAYWTEKVANKGCAAAQYNMGKFFEEGIGVDQDLKEAFSWYYKAANNGDIDAVSNVGLFYYTGKGVDINEELGMEYLEKAASMGNAKATYNLGIAYRDKLDFIKAQEYLEKAIKLGHPSAQKGLDQLKKCRSGNIADIQPMQDLTFISKRHQRYEHGVPVKEMQHCGRTFIITNSNFRELMNEAPVTPAEGFLVRLFNTDVRGANGGYQEMMQPKFMTLVSSTTNKIELKGVALTLMGVTAMDFSDYAITLHLINRKVAKCVLHMLDRDVDIEYLDIQP